MFACKVRWGVSFSPVMLLSWYFTVCWALLTGVTSFASYGASVIDPGPVARNGRSSTKTATPPGQGVVRSAAIWNVLMAILWRVWVEDILVDNSKSGRTQYGEFLRHVAIDVYLKNSTNIKIHVPFVHLTVLPTYWSSIGLMNAADNFWRKFLKRIKGYCVCRPIFGLGKVN